jgi:hypothetical protein
VSLGDIENWIASDDIEIMGFTHGLLSDDRFRIDPPISLSAYIKFTKHYFGRCIRENHEGQWSESRYTAGATFVNLFGSLWRDQTVPREVLSELKTWLEQLYREGDPAIRTCIVHAALEHLFEQEEIRNFFSDWEQDKVFAAAAREAAEWYQGGGSSPLGKPLGIP